jgi:pyridoxamine 5'-phosphate oxidase
MNLDQLRQKYMSEGLELEALNPDPFQQFQRWFSDAIDSGLPEPNAMSLATVDRDGQPWQRIVLLKLVDAEGLVFFTNYESRKAAQITDNPRVGLLLPWQALGRQVQVTGRAERISAAESMRYFATRPRGSQLGAWASPQSRVISSRSLLLAKVEEMKRKFAEGEIPLPSFWGGYRVVPEVFEFWQAGEYRLHDRFVYTRSGEGGWSIERLAP